MATDAESGSLGGDGGGSSEKVGDPGLGAKPKWLVSSGSENDTWRGGSLVTL